ncbi:MAG: ferrous iron transport protein B [Thermodesulfovibrionales bacterium]|nr:ferrous iron transport protein B [Thermodesulfovibrionales bacterium]
MHTHETEKAKAAAASGKYRRIALIGNPNVGKSVIFGLLTGKYATVSNYPGTTVEVAYGNAAIEGKKYLFVDTPGVNSLIPMSEDEKVTRDILLGERPSVVLQVGDAKNLKRTLLITIQLAEMGLPVILVLNMEDEAMDRGIIIAKDALKSMTGIEVIMTVAPEKKGLKELRAAISKGDYRTPLLNIKYNPHIEECIEKLLPLMPDAGISKRSLALMVVSGDESLRGWFNANMETSAIEQVEAVRAECILRMKQPVGMAISGDRLRRAEEIAEKVIKRVPGEGGSFSSFIGRLSMHPVWGIPLLLAVLFGFYEFVGVFGAGTLVDFLEETIFGKYLNPMFTKVVETLIPFALIRDMLVGQYGLITMALTYAIGIILPITTTFFIAFSILEDSGYLPRLAIMSDRVFNIMGLSGKAVLPMVLGLGCGTMAVMTTRILESRRDRAIAAFLLALAVPCSAQLGVILGMLAALSAKAMAIWIGSVLGVLLFSGFLASKIVPGERTEFFLEIPPIRKPALRNVAVKTASRAVWYLKEAVPLFMLGTFILFILDKLSILRVIERFASPVIVGVLGLPPKATEAFLIGFFRRDYGAAGLFAMSEKGLLTPEQSLVSLVTITLFIPCLAHLLMTIKEMGLRYALSTAAIIFSTAILAGGALNFALRFFSIAV